MLKVNPKITSAIAKIGVEESTALELNNAFAPFLKQAAEWKEKAEALVVTDISQVSEMKEAREGRLMLKNIRVEANKKRKELKEESLRYGKAVQGVYNLIEGLIKPIEEHLLQQEKFAEVQRQKEIDALSAKRTDEIQPYAEFVAVNLDFGNMSEEDYQNTLRGAKLLHEAKLKEAADLEAQRIEEEAKARAEREAIQKENERLRNEAEEREAALAAERKERERIEAEQKAAEEAERQRKENERLAEEKAKAAPDNMKVIRYAALLEEIEVPDLSLPEAIEAIARIQSVIKEIRLNFSKKV